MKKWLSRAHFSYSTFVEEEDWYRYFLFSYSFYSEIETMTYMTAFVVSLLIFALIIVWSLIEIKQDLHKDEEMKSEF